ncbi:MAG: tripartite tricarboxylate transporter TctB family protein [Reyranellaceae bacterium]
MRPSSNWPQAIGGVFFIGLALAGLWLNQSYELGTTRRMGPGYLPMLVFLAMAALGAAIVVASLRRPRAALEPTRWRSPLAVVGAMAAFTLLIESLGLAAAVAAATLLVSIAAGDFRLLRAIALAVFLAAFCWLVFVNALDIGITLFPALR